MYTKPDKHLLHMELTQTFKVVLPYSQSYRIINFIGYDQATGTKAQAQVVLLNINIAKSLTL